MGNIILASFSFFCTYGVRNRNPTQCSLLTLLGTEKIQQSFLWFRLRTRLALFPFGCGSWGVLGYLWGFNHVVLGFGHWRNCHVFILFLNRRSVSFTLRPGRWLWFLFFIHRFPICVILCTCLTVNHERNTWSNQVLTHVTIVIQCFLGLHHLFLFQSISANRNYFLLSFLTSLFGFRCSSISHINIILLLLLFITCGRHICRCLVDDFLNLICRIIRT